MDRVPILVLGDCLLVSIQVELEDHTVLTLQEDLAERIVEKGARGVVIDISGVEIVDSFIGRMLASTAALARVLDAETVVVGMRPAVAITLVELGVSFDGVRTALNLEKGLTILRELSARPGLGGQDHSRLDGAARTGPLSGGGKGGTPPAPGP